MIETISFPGKVPFVVDGHGEEEGAMFVAKTDVPKDTRPPLRLVDECGVQIACFADPRRCIDAAVQLRSPMTVVYHGETVLHTSRRRGESRAATCRRLLPLLVEAMVDRNEALDAYKARVLAAAGEAA